jgi:phosphate transport system permease protein
MPASDRPRSPFAAVRGRLAPGQAGIWTTALATLFVLILLVGLLWIVVVNAFGWFWPTSVWRMELADGIVVVGQRVGLEDIPVASGGDTAEPATRLKLKVGNRDLTGRDFMWIDLADIVSASRPDDLVRIVRSEYGDAFGEIVDAVGLDGQEIDPGDRTALTALLESGEDARDRRRALEHRLEKVRHPLTTVEEELDIRERSEGASTDTVQAEIAALRQRADELGEVLAPELQKLEDELVETIQLLDRGHLSLKAGGDTFDVTLARVIRVTWPNTLGWPRKVYEAAREGVQFLFTEPREANTEGGVFPALFGTVLLVLLMSLAVVPLGVVTAVYMTEYARTGLLLRLANQAVNNLAGVPSIVFGMFGLAFFIYGVGGSIDRTLFADRLPTPTFGTGGILWASLTLALLTVPVVVVATREGLLAVPRSWRDGSLALGATKWQTLRRIILPAAMPGILTGLILAVSRAAGEVAPLMLTGAVKLAPSLPVDGSPPFLHLQRKFMHLGFHIYDVSMQSPNVEAAKPMAFATTLVLLLLVVLMNLTAIVIRRRLRRAYRGQAV